MMHRQDFETKQALRPCPVCAGEEVAVLHTQPFVLQSGHILPNIYDVVCCVGCGFVYADTPAPQRDYDLYYAQFSKYDDSKTGTGGGAAQYDASRLRETALAIGEVLKNPEAKVLDAGCALGGLLRELQLAGCSNVQGLDPSPASQIYAREHFDLTIHTGSITEPSSINEFNEPFDCVILSHVLEHLRDVETTFRHLRQLCRLGGVLYLEVPDAARYRDCVVAPFQDFNVEHINHFDGVHLDQLAARFGFERIKGASKTISAADGVPYPALYAFYRRTQAQGVNSPDESGRDELRQAILDYIDISCEMLDKMEIRLREGCRAREIVVWGTGQLTLKLLAQTSLRDASIACFIDANPIHQGKELNGVAVLSPAQFQETSWCNDGVSPILIATTIHQQAIAERIEGQLMWNNPLITLKDSSQAKIQT
jgi:SAM-dependent methyltransferase